MKQILNARSFLGVKLSDIISYLFIILFIYAATNKLLEFNLFKAQLGKSPLILGHSWWVAWVVPSSEIFIAVAFFIPRMVLPAFYASFSLMFGFTLYIGFILTFSPYVPCSCGGILNNMGWVEHLIFNIVFTLLAVAGIVLYLKENQDHAIMFNAA